MKSKKRRNIALTVSAIFVAALLACAAALSMAGAWGGFGVAKAEDDETNCETDGHALVGTYDETGTSWSYACSVCEETIELEESTPVYSVTMNVTDADSFTASAAWNEISNIEPTFVLQNDFEIHTATYFYRDATIDLNGKKLTGPSDSDNVYVFRIDVNEEYGDADPALTINDSAGGAEVDGYKLFYTMKDCTIVVNGGTYTVSEGGKIANMKSGSLYINDGDFTCEGKTNGVELYNDLYANTEGAVGAHFEMNGGSITVTGAAAALTSNNTQASGCSAVINGGKLISKVDTGIYWPIEGELTVNDGYIEGATGIDIKMGKLTVNGGKIVGTGEFDENLNSNNSGSQNDGSAIRVDGQQYGSNSSYYIESDELIVTINGGELISQNGHAVAIYDNEVVGDNEEEVSVSITGGNFTSAEGCDSLLFKSADDSEANDEDSEFNMSVSISGGTYDSPFHGSMLSDDTLSASYDGTVYVGTSEEVVQAITDAAEENGETEIEITFIAGSGDLDFGTDLSVEVNVQNGYGSEKSDVTVKSATGSTVYVKSEDELNTALSSEEITKIILGDDITLSNALYVYTDITIDLSGHTLTGASTGYVIRAQKANDAEYGPNVTVCDNSVDGGGKIEGNRIFRIADGSTVTMDNIDCVASGDHAVWVYEGGKFVMDGGSMTFADSSSATYGVVLVQGEFEMNGGEVALNVANSVGAIYVFGGTFTMNGGCVKGSPYTITMYNSEASNTSSSAKGGSIVINDGVVYSEGIAISTNNTQSARCSLEINGGLIYSSGNVAIYWPSEGSLTITGGYIVGLTGIDIKMGTLTITGGTIVGTGTNSDSLPNDSGMTNPNGSAIEIIGQEYGNSSNNYIDSPDLTVSISGGNILSQNGHAVTVYDIEDATGEKVNVAISGGTFESADGMDSIYFEAKDESDANSGEYEMTIAVSGGEYSSPFQGNLLSDDIVSVMYEDTVYVGSADDVVEAITEAASGETEISITIIAGSGSLTFTDMEVTVSVSAEYGYANNGITVNDDPIAHIHTWDDGIVTSEATCTEDGVLTHTCSECDETYTEVIEASGHDYQLDTSAEGYVGATCGDGTNVYVCTRCGDSYTETVTGTGNHTYVKDDVNSTDSTCGEEGTTIYVCSVCGDSYTETVAATGEHTWNDGEVTTEATCGEAGVRTYTCMVCGVTKTEEIAATGNHTYVVDEANSTEATCGADGTTAYVCSVCGDTSKPSETISATGEHTVTDWTWIDDIEANCGLSGSRTGTCDVCGAEVTETIEATGEHTYFDDPVYKDGSWYDICEVCGYEELIVDATGRTFKAQTLDELQSALDMDGATVAMQNDIVGSVTISVSVTLDLNGYTLSDAENASNDAAYVGTIDVLSGGNLTVVDSSDEKSGVVDCVTDGRGALVVEAGGAAVLYGGTFTRSLESEDNSWHTIANAGTLTINEGTTVENGGTYYAAIVNGWTGVKASRIAYYAASDGAALEIKGGSFSGGLYTVLNEDGETVISGGDFTNGYVATIANRSRLTISGGKFANEYDGSDFDSCLILNLEGDGSDPETTISGGELNGVIIIEAGTVTLGDKVYGEEGPETLEIETDENGDQSIVGDEEDEGNGPDDEDEGNEPDKEGEDDGDDAAFDDEPKTYEKSLAWTVGLSVAAGVVIVLGLILTAVGCDTRKRK